jgi:hypothetical protein
MVFCESGLPSDDVESFLNKIGKVFSLEYTNIPKVFFTPHHGLLRHQGNQGNDKYHSGLKGKNGIQGNYCNDVFQGHCCNNVIQDNYRNYVNQCHCCNSVFQDYCNNVYCSSEWNRQEYNKFFYSRVRLHSRHNTSIFNYVHAVLKYATMKKQYVNRIIIGTIYYVSKVILNT